MATWERWTLGMLASQAGWQDEAGERQVRATDRTPCDAWRICVCAVQTVATSHMVAEHLRCAQWD